jgi:putative hemolysin
MMGIDPDQMPEEVTEEEIRMMIDVGEEYGSIEESEKDMIHNIFELDDRAVEDMMTHRTEITGVEAAASFEETIALVVGSRFSRIPVYEDDLDGIIGVLYAKDLLEVAARGGDGFAVRRYMRTPLYVPESTSAKLLLTEFKEKKIQLAVVVDEYGGTSGIVTMEDLMESIVGDIQDEYDDEDEAISQTGENRFLIDGLTPLEEVAKFFDLEIADEDDFDTIGGYILGRLGFIPEQAECPEVTMLTSERENVQFTIRKMDDHRVDKLEAQLVVGS